MLSKWLNSSIWSIYEIVTIIITLDLSGPESNSNKGARDILQTRGLSRQKFEFVFVVL